MLRHHPGGALAFVVRYHRGTEQVLVQIGNYPEISLEQAHDAHTAIRRQLAAGLDPAEELEREKRARQAASERRRTDDAVTVRNVIAEWGWHFARRERKRPREAVRLLKVYVAQPWKGQPVRDLVKRDAVLLLDRITARGSLVMANRIRDLANQAFNFAIGRDLIEANPFAGIKKPGGAEAAKERALNADELRTFWQRLEAPETKMSPIVRLALKLILVTAQRPGEVIGARWEEFDLAADAPLWRIPAARAKNGKAHEVPLSDLAVEILGQMRTQVDGERPCIAPSHMSQLAADESLSERALSRALRNNHDDDGKLFGVPAFTPHDLRRSAATQMTLLGIQRLHVAKVLGHADSDITAVYDRSTYEVEKRVALQTWADHLRAIIAGKKSGKVAPIRKSAA